MVCKTYPLGELKEYKYVVILSEYDGRILLSRHKERTTWETQGGHIEATETPFEAAKRELYEESGAIQYEIAPFCDYWAGNEETKEGASGVVFTAKITKLGAIPESEMQEVKTFGELPEKLTYPAISTALFEKLRETGMPEEWQSVELWDVYGEDGSVTGDILVRGEEIPEGCFHAVAKVFVVHEDESVLLMRRHLKKPAYPGCWECGAGGAVLKGEHFSLAARRELLEETGILADELKPIYQTLSGNCYFVGYLCVTNVAKGAVRLQKDETIDYKWVDKETFLEIYDTQQLVGAKRLRDFVAEWRK